MTETETEQQCLRHAETVSPTLALAVKAAAAAGQVIRGRCGELQTVEVKDVGDLVSQVDLDADRAACDLLRESSDLPILSEELNSSIAESDELWIVDPLDASTSFLMQAGPEFPSVLIARREHGQTTVGVCYFPLTGEWFYAQRGRGAWRNGKRLVCDSSEQLGEVWVEMNQYGNAELETEYFARLRNRLRSPEGARLVTSNAPYSGVAMRIAAAASPLAVAIHDNRPSHPKQCPWDIAAPQVILEEAGGVFVNPEGRRSDPFRVEPLIVARDRSLADQIIELGMWEPSAT